MDGCSRLNASSAAIETERQLSALSRLTGLSVNTAIALNAFWLTLGFEVAAMFTRLAAGDSGPSRPINARPTPIPLTALAPVGDVRRFLLACLPRAKGQRVSLSAVFARYRQWCAEQRVRELDATAFTEAFEAISQRVALRTRRCGSKVFLMDVRLVA
jgi:hypothetical protein